MEGQDDDAGDAAAEGLDGDEEPVGLETLLAQASREEGFSCCSCSDTLVNHHGPCQHLALCACVCLYQLAWGLALVVSVSHSMHVAVLKLCWTKRRCADKECVL